MGRPHTAQTCWLTEAAWLCWWWASSWSPLCWSWRWLHTAVWPDTSSWACASSRTAGPCTRTCQPPSTVDWALAAAGAEMESMVVERQRSGCEMKVREMGRGRWGRPLDEEYEGNWTRQQSAGVCVWGGVVSLRKGHGCKSSKGDQRREEVVKGNYNNDQLPERQVTLF